MLPSAYVEDDLTTSLGSKKGSSAVPMKATPSFTSRGKLDKQELLQAHK